MFTYKKKLIMFYCYGWMYVKVFFLVKFKNKNDNKKDIIKQ